MVSEKIFEGSIATGFYINISPRVWPVWTTKHCYILNLLALGPMVSEKKIFEGSLAIYLSLYLFVLRFYGPVNPMGSCRAWSVYLTTRLLDRFSPLSG